MDSESTDKQQCASSVVDLVLFHNHSILNVYVVLHINSLYSLLFCSDLRAVSV